MHNTCALLVSNLVLWRLLDIEYNNFGINIDRIKLNVLGFAAKQNLVGKNKEMIAQITKVELIHEVKKIGLDLEMIEKKTKEMETFVVRGRWDLMVENYVKPHSFKYLGVMITGNNDLSKEIATSLSKQQRALFASIKYFKSKILFRGTKYLYMAIIGPTITHGHSDIKER